MRFLFRLFIFLIVLVLIAYTVGWFFAAAQVKERLQEFATNSKGGDQTLSFDNVEVTGFPVSFKVNVTNAVVQDFDQGIEWRAPTDSGIFVSALKPLTVNANLNGRHEISPIGDKGTQIPLTLDLQSETMSVTGGTDQTIQAVNLAISTLTITSDQFGDLKIDGLKFNLNPPTNLGANFSTSIERISLPEPFSLMGEVTNARSNGVILPALPKTFKERHMAAWQRSGGDVIIEEFVAHVDPARIDGDGAVKLSGDLQPTLQVNAYATGVDALIERTVELGFVPQDQANLAKMGTLMFQKPARSGDGKELVFPLKIDDGWIVFGPFKLRKLPKISWPK